MSSSLNSESPQLDGIPLQEVHTMTAEPGLGNVELSFSPSKLSNLAESNSLAFEKMKKVSALDIQKPPLDLNGNEKSFAPFVSSTIKVPAEIGFNYGANLYNSKNNKIICCPSNSTVHFYDADGLTPMKDHSKKQLGSSVVQMSYCEKTDIYLLGCASGNIYAYNATENRFSDVLKEGHNFILAITHLDENNFVFSSSKSGKLFFRSLKSEKTIQEFSRNSDVWYLHYLSARNLLLAGHADGKITVYKSKRNERKYSMIGCLQGHKFGKFVTTIVSANIKGKEYIITGGNDKTIKIWHVIKGKLKLLKTIQNNHDVSTLVYLEEHQMIASTHHNDYVSFFKLPQGKLEAKVNLGMDKIRNIFYMKEKNAIGVATLSKNVIKIVQLFDSGEKDQKDKNSRRGVL